MNTGTMNHLYRSPAGENAHTGVKRVLAACGRITTWKHISPPRFLTCPRCAVASLLQESAEKARQTGGNS